MHDAYRLGASLYIPAVHKSLRDVLVGNHLADVRSLIACTEDAIAECDVAHGLEHLRAVLPSLAARSPDRLCFVRPRNPDVLAELLSMDGIERMHGFVIPKADIDTLPRYERLLAGRDFWVMPTLETLPVLDPLGQREMRCYLQASAIRRQILALRIGGNDLLRLLAMKRTRGVSLYETPIGALVQQLVLSFRPHGFHLTAPVFDFFDDPQTLTREIRTDVTMGLVGKTAIHPLQVPIIERALAVSEDDLRTAHAILAADEAVFQCDGAMIEPTVHARWARSVLARGGATDVVVDGPRTERIGEAA